MFWEGDVSWGDVLRVGHFVMRRFACASVNGLTKPYIKHVVFLYYMYWIGMSVHTIHIYVCLSCFPHTKSLCESLYLIRESVRTRLTTDQYSSQWQICTNTIYVVLCCMYCIVHSGIFINCLHKHVDHVLRGTNGSAWSSWTQAGKICGVFFHRVFQTRMSTRWLSDRSDSGSAVCLQRWFVNWWSLRLRIIYKSFVNKLILLFRGKKDSAVRW